MTFVILHESFSICLNALYYLNVVKLTALDGAAKTDFDERLWLNIEKQLAKYMEWDDPYDIETLKRRSQSRASMTSLPISDPPMDLVPLYLLKKFYELDIAKNMAFCLLEIPVLMLIEMFYIEIMVTPWEGEFIYENVWMTVNNIVTFFVTLQYSMHAVRYFLLNAHPCLEMFRNAAEIQKKKDLDFPDHVTLRNDHFKILGYLSKLSGLNFGKCLYLLCVFFIQIASISKFALVFMIGTRYIMLDKYDLFNDPEIYDWYDSNMGTKVDWWATPNNTEHEFAQTLDVTQIMNVGQCCKRAFGRLP